MPEFALMAARRFNAWGHYPGTFSFQALEAAFAVVSEAGVVVDPFVGTGTAATFATGRGDRFYGIEAHPLTAALAQMRMSRPGPADELRAAAHQLSCHARRAIRARDLTGEDSVLRRFVPADSLTELVAFRDAVEAASERWREHLRWAVLGALRDSCGRKWPHAAPRIGSSKAKSVADLVERRLREMANELAAAPKNPDSSIVCSDSRDPKSWRHLPPASVEASVSSPPYLNQVCYAEVPRLELHFLGWAHSWKEMRALADNRLVASSTQQVDRPRAARAWQEIAKHPGTSSTLMPLTRRLQRVQDMRPRPKRYDLLLPTYFADMIQVLKQLHRSLCPGGRAAWVVGDSAPYGVYVDTPALLGLAASEVGFEVLEDLHLRQRGGRWAGVSGRHNRSLTERLLVLARPAPGAQEPLPGFA